MATYVRQSKIDSGGFGCVYRAKRKDDGEIVAFKVLEDPGITDEDRARFGREVRIQTQLSHANIVSVVGSNLTATPPFFVMPLATGTLRSKIAAGEYKGNLQAVMAVFTQLLDGMEYAHANGVVHRDLKPENVLFFDEDVFGGEVAKIGDFGLGKRMTAESLTLTQSYIGMGTAAYMPPEQYLNFKKADARADIYSLGKVLYELLTSELPLHVNLGHPELPKGFGYVIGRCLEHGPDKRYQSVLELRTDLLELTSDQKKFAHPQKEVAKLIQLLESNPASPKKLVDEIDRLFSQNGTDEAFYTEYFVKMGAGAIAAYVKYNSVRFLERLRTFDSFVSGSLAFGYTDTVADFYERIWRASSSLDARRIVLERLLNMGHWHNRFHVAGVFGKLIASIENPEQALMARDVLRKDSSAAQWMRPYCDAGALPVVMAGFPPVEKKRKSETLLAWRTDLN